MDVHLPIAGMSVNSFLRLGPGGAVGSLSGLPGVVPSIALIGPAVGARIGRDPILAPGDLDSHGAGGGP